MVVWGGLFVVGEEMWCEGVGVVGVWGENEEEEGCVFICLVCRK